MPQSTVKSPSSLTPHRALRTEETQVEHGSSVSVFADAPPRLRGLVVGGYQGWVERSNLVSRRRELPCAFVPLILNWGPSFGIIDPLDASALAHPYASFVAGLSDRYVVVESSGTSACIQVNFTPLGARMLVGMPMDELTDRTVELEDVFGSATRDLITRLSESPDWETRFRVLDAALIERVAAAASPCRGVAWAWSALVESHGRMSIGALGRELGWSRKRLVARFRDQLGLPPKTLARVLRFDHVIAQLRTAREVHWAELAQGAGYYDQAHFIREFGAFAGCPPSDFLSRRLPDGGVRD